MSTITRTVTIKEDEEGLYVLYKPQFDWGTGAFPGGKFTVRIPDSSVFGIGNLEEPFKAGEKVAVQEFNSNMGWYKVRRKSTGEYSLWEGPRWEVNGFTSCWVEK